MSQGCRRLKLNNSYGRKNWFYSRLTLQFITILPLPTLWFWIPILDTLDTANFWFVTDSCYQCISFYICIRYRTKLLIFFIVYVLITPNFKKIIIVALPKMLRHRQPKWMIWPWEYSNAKIDWIPNTNWMTNYNCLLLHMFSP